MKRRAEELKDVVFDIQERANRIAYGERAGRRPLGAALTRYRTSGGTLAGGRRCMVACS